RTEYEMSSEARLSTADLGRVLRDHGDGIVAHFVAQVRRDDVPPSGVSRAGLVDHIPRFLAEMASELSRLASGEQTPVPADTSSSAREHGVQRWEIGYDLRALV